MVVLHFLLLRIGIHAVSDGHGGRAVAGPVVFGGFTERFAGSLSGCHGFCDLFWGGSVSEQLREHPFRPTAGVMVVVGGYPVECPVDAFQRIDAAVRNGVEDTFQLE